MAGAFSGWPRPVQPDGQSTVAPANSGSGDSTLITVERSASCFDPVLGVGVGDPAVQGWPGHVQDSGNLDDRWAGIDEAVGGFDLAVREGGATTGGASLGDRIGDASAVDLQFHFCQCCSEGHQQGAHRSSGAQVADTDVRHAQVRVLVLEPFGQGENFGGGVS